MKRILLMSVNLILCFLFQVGAVHAADVGDPAAAFKKDYPAVQFENIEKTDIDGVYEVTAGGNLLYYYPQRGYILFGELYNKSGQNLTAERRDVILAKKIKNLPLDKAIKIGMGKKTVIEFTDLDCPFCRKAEEFFKDRKDVTRYVFLYPLQQLHPLSMAKSLKVLCVKKSARAAAYTEAVSGSLDKLDLKGAADNLLSVCGDQKKIDLLMEYGKLGRELGIAGTPSFWINGVHVSGADFKRLGELLDDSQSQMEGR